MADDLRLGDLGEPGRLGAQQPGRDQLLDRDVAAGDPGGGDRAARRPGTERS